MYYTLRKDVGLCGYKGLPFGLAELDGIEVHFFNEEEYKLILMLDGQTEIDFTKLSESQKHVFDFLKGIDVVVESNEKNSLTDEQEYKFYPAIYKKNVQWSITGSCNYKCKHCFMSAPDCKYVNPTKEECMDIIKQFAECGVRGVSLTGGEPLVSPYFFDIIDECLRRNIKIVTIYSNGYLITREFLDKLKQRTTQANFQLSFDGIGWHDWLRGIDGAEEKVLNAFKLLDEYGYGTTAAFCVNKHNLTTINESLRLLDKYNVRNLKISRSLPSGLWKNETEHFLSNDEMYQYMLDVAIPQYLKDNLTISAQFSLLITYYPTRQKVDLPGAKFFGIEDSLGAYACASLKGGMYISPEGNILPCMSMVGTPLEKIYPSIKKTPLKEILSDSLYYKHILSLAKEVIEHNENCKKCEYKLVCGGGCRACVNNCENADFYGYDKSTCDFFKKGWYTKAKLLVDDFVKNEENKTRKNF